jgi:hypothetical protein
VTASTGVAAARVSQGSTYGPNGRTTPIDFGTVDPGSTPPQKTFTVSNIGSAALTLGNLILPDGYSLVGSFPSTIAAGSSASFTIRMATDDSGTDAGILSFDTNDPNAPTYRFNVKGIVTGGDTGAIHGQVVNDQNGDGIENPDETGLTGWTVSLLDPATNDVIATTTTGFNGYYIFLNLAPGTYRVRETLPDGWTQTTPDPADVTVGTDDVLASPFGVAVSSPAPFAVRPPHHGAAATRGELAPAAASQTQIVVALVSPMSGARLASTVIASDASGNVAAGSAGTLTSPSSNTDARGLLPPDYTATETDALWTVHQTPYPRLRPQLGLPWDRTAGALWRTSDMTDQAGHGVEGTAAETAHGAAR